MSSPTLYRQSFSGELLQERRLGTKRNDSVWILTGFCSCGSSPEWRECADCSSGGDRVAPGLASNPKRAPVDAVECRCDDATRLFPSYNRRHVYSPQTRLLERRGCSLHCTVSRIRLMSSRSESPVCPQPMISTTVLPI